MWHRYLYLLFLVAVTSRLSQVIAGSDWRNVCEGSIILGGGQIIMTSWNFPWSSTRNLECNTTVSAPPGHLIKIKFHYFHTEACCDHLRVYDGPTMYSSLQRELSGLNLPISSMSTGNTLTFKWNNHGWDAGVGFVLSLVALDPIETFHPANVTQSKTEMEKKLDRMESRVMNTITNGFSSIQQEKVSKQDFAEALVAMYVMQEHGGS